MKLSHALLPAAFAAPALSQGMVGWSWEMDNAPETGLKDIVFPMAISGSPNEKRYYYAHQFQFKGVDDVGYAGLQPQENQTDGTAIRGVFSSFIEGTTSDDENCSDGADGGAGVSCGVVFTGDYDHTYHLAVRNTGGTTWSGTLIDVDTGKETHIGEYTIPSGTRGITNGDKNLGFIEDYVGVTECTSVKQGAVQLGDPFTETMPDVSGQIAEPYEYGPCPEKASFKSNRNEADDGWEMTIGWWYMGVGKQ